MSRLPLLEKNAYLKIYVSKTGIYSHLAYSHYEVNRSYILKDFSDLPADFVSFSDTQATEFWKGFMNSLEKKFGWNFVAEISGTYMVKAFSDEENGVNGIQILFEDDASDLQLQLVGLRNYCPDIRIEKFVDDDFMKMLRGFFQKFDYREVLYIDLNLTGSKVVRFDRSRKSIGTLDAAYSDYEYIKMQAKTLKNDEVIVGIRDAKFKAFLRESSTNAQLTNYLANYLYSGTFDTDSAVIKDILRALGVIQLLSIYNSNKEKLNGFGIQQYSDDNAELREYAVIVSGNLAKLLNNRDLIINILDGLQIRGHFDLFYDFDKLLCTFGNSYFFGVNSQDIILSRHDMLSEVDRIIIPEVASSKKDRKVVMTGVMANAELGNTTLYALAPQITTIDIPKQKVFFDFEFIGDSFVKDIGQKIKFDYDPEKHNFRKIIIDCRYKPVVYGPDAKTNKLRMEEWLNE